MAKIKLQGNASGSGVLTVTAPNTSTDRTITLPDSTGTLLTADGDGSSLTGVGVSGITSSADATAIKIDSSERVAIGNINAGDYNSSADNLVVYDATQHAGITIASGGTDKTGNIYFADGTSGDAEYEGYIEYNHNGNQMSFGANHATTLTLKSDGRGLSQFTAKAWINFNGSGTVSIRDSHNISSVTDNSVGHFTCNFTNNMGNDGYFGTFSNNYDGPGWLGAFNTSSIQVINNHNGYQDPSRVTVLVFGD